MKDWLYQVRFRVSEELSEDLRSKNKLNISKQIQKIAKKYSARPVCTFDAFSDYCKQAELNGTENYPLYDWTKSTIENPEKRSKHLKSFALYVGDDQVYEKKIAKQMYDNLKFLLEEKKIYQLNLIDTNPKNNPQPPSKV